MLGPRCRALALGIYTPRASFPLTRTPSLTLQRLLSLSPRKSAAPPSTMKLYHRLALASSSHCRLHLAHSCATFPSTSSTWLQRLTSYGEGVFAVFVLTGDLSTHGRLHGELAAAWLARALLVIPRFRAWSEGSLASGMTLSRLGVSPVRNTTTRERGRSSSEHLV